ncbi:MAG TPA: energy transducer TonB [Steroidobacteraceae bacterium]|nr:energy transducer TonB [Steroidobacteraceae bacterium]
MKYYKDHDYTNAINEFKRSAVLGHKLSQFDVGVMYLQGQGVKKDLIEAYAWLAISAMDNNPERVQTRDYVMSQMDEAQKNAAIDRMEKLLTEINQEAEKLEPVIVSDENCKFHLTSVRRYPVRYPDSMIYAGKQDTTDVEYTIDKQGFPRDYSVSVSLGKDFDTAIFNSLKRWRYQVTILDGKPVEVTNAEIRFRFRIVGGEMDKAAVRKYVKELRERASKGSAPDLYAAAYIGDLVSELGIKKEESNRWYYQAAQAGYSKAQYEIGKSLFRGEGCEQDIHKGLQWLTMAAEDESADAEYFLGISLLGSNKITEDKPQAIAWLNKAAAGKSDKAMMRLAWILATDKDDHVRDPARALQLVKEVYDNYADKLRSNETLAAVQAANGLFDDAVLAQKKAIKEAKYIHYPLDDLNARLDAYNSHQAWRE